MARASIARTFTDWVPEQFLGVGELHDALRAALGMHPELFEHKGLVQVTGGSFTPFIEAKVSRAAAGVIHSHQAFAWPPTIFPAPVPEFQLKLELIQPWVTGSNIIAWRHAEPATAHEAALELIKARALWERLENALRRRD